MIVFSVVLLMLDAAPLDASKAKFSFVVRNEFSHDALGVGIRRRVDMHMVHRPIGPAALRLRDQLFDLTS